MEGQPTRSESPAFSPAQVCLSGSFLLVRGGQLRLYDQPAPASCLPDSISMLSSQDAELGGSSIVTLRACGNLFLPCLGPGAGGSGGVGGDTFSHLSRSDHAERTLSGAFL